MRRHCVRAALSILAVSSSLTSACGGTESSSPKPSPDQLTLTETQIRSLDSTGQILEQSNPTNANLKSLVDSTLLVLKAGIVLQRIDVTTDLTTSPLYFVGIHRFATTSTGSSFSTWNVVGINDPSNLTSIVEVSGFAQSAGPIVPLSVSATIGDGTGVVNGRFLTVGAAGAVTEWFADAGSASFSSGPSGAPCPNFTATAVVTCSLETLHMRVSASASSGSGGAGARQATIKSYVDVPTMRLTYAF